MYNEDEDLFTRTMHGVMLNIKHLCTRERSRTWSKEGWKKVRLLVYLGGMEIDLGSGVGGRVYRLRWAHENQLENVEYYRGYGRVSAGRSQERGRQETCHCAYL